MRERTSLNSNKTIKNASTEINKYHPPVYTLNEHLFYICNTCNLGKKIRYYNS